MEVSAVTVQGIERQQLLHRLQRFDDDYNKILHSAPALPPPACLRTAPVTGHLRG
jgi:hypothetical protein